MLRWRKSRRRSPAAAAAAVGVFYCTLPRLYGRARLPGLTTLSESASEPRALWLLACSARATRIVSVDIATKVSRVQPLSAGSCLPRRFSWPSALFLLLFRECNIPRAPGEMLWRSNKGSYVVTGPVREWSGLAQFFFFCWYLVCVQCSSAAKENKTRTRG